jgi:hypothetical protein
MLFYAVLILLSCSVFNILPSFSWEYVSKLLRGDDNQYVFVDSIRRKLRDDSKLSFSMLKKGKDAPAPNYVLWQLHALFQPKEIENKLGLQTKSLKHYFSAGNFKKLAQLHQKIVYQTANFCGNVELVRFIKQLITAEPQSIPNDKEMFFDASRFMDLPHSLIVLQNI